MEDPVSPSDLTGLEEGFSQIALCQSFPQTPKQRERFTVEVEDKQGKVGILSVRMSDNPKQLASEFASEHHLDREQLEILEQYILQNQHLAAKSMSEVSLEVLTGSTAAGGEGKAREVSKFKCTQSRVPVHERLYQQRRRMTPDFRLSLTPSSSLKRSNPDYCTFLYMRGMQSKESLRLRAEQLKESLELQQSKEATFLPAINRISSLMTPRINLSTEEALFRKAGEKSQRMAIKRSLSEELQLKSCSFTPKINHKPAFPKSPRPRFAQLYEEACKRTERKLRAAVTPQFPFKPKLYLAMSTSKPESKSRVDRVSKPKSIVKAEEKSVQRGSLTDRSTALPLFEPKVLQKERRSLGGQSIHEYLYSMKPQAAHRSQQTDATTRQSPQPSALTQDYVRSLKKKTFRRYFDLLDHDHTGRISLGKSALTVLDKRIATLLGTVVKKTGNAGITFEQFTDRIEEVMKTLSPGEKSILVRGEDGVKDSGKRVSGKQPCSSMGFVARPSTRLSDASDIYARSQELKEVIITQKTQAKLRAQKESRERTLAQLCTFRPFMVKGKLRSGKNLH